MDTATFSKTLQFPDCWKSFSVLQLTCFSRRKELQHALQALGGVLKFYSAKVAPSHWPWRCGCLDGFYDGVWGAKTSIFLLVDDWGYHHDFGKLHDWCFDELVDGDAPDKLDVSSPTASPAEIKGGRWEITHG